MFIIVKLFEAVNNLFYSLFYLIIFILVFLILVVSLWYVWLNCNTIVINYFVIMSNEVNSVLIKY